MPTFEEIQDKCIRYKKLWEDPDFPATSESIYGIGSQDEDGCLWKRPREICKLQPKFIVPGETSFDLAQGESGDVWFVACAALLATKSDLFAQVVPVNQGFVNYIGAFRFNLWHLGEWTEVIVDDRLPVNEDEELIYCRNRTHPHEFWGPLLEKAYAKLKGCYKAIADGHVRNGLVDLTGGISELYTLRRDNEIPDDLFEVIQASQKSGSLLGTMIWNDAGKTQEREVWNGLYRGHVYSITGVIQTRVQGWRVRLIRLRNPWGKSQWSGAWSDNSDEWKAVPAEKRLEINLVIDEQSEFWMTYEDLVKNFTTLDIVHIGPSTFTKVPMPKDTIKWHEIQCSGSWVKGVSAGGNGSVSPLRLYYRNPRYFTTLRTPDRDALNITGECTVVVSLLLKNFRQKKFARSLKWKCIVGFDVHMVRSGKPEMMDKRTFEDRTILKKKFETQTDMREVTTRLILDPGTYCIIPHTSQADQEATFLLRVFSYAPVDIIELYETTGQVVGTDLSKSSSRAVGSINTDLFAEIAEVELVVDARDLRDLLNVISRKEFGQTSTFNVESCRTLISIIDEDETGVLDYEQTTKLWDDIIFWKKLFDKYDRDRAGFIETWELPEAFKEVGFALSYRTLKTLAVRYGGKDRTLSFEDFVVCLTKTIALFNMFTEFNKDSDDDAKVQLEDWMYNGLRL